MTRREIAALCCRLLALVVLTWAIIYSITMLLALGTALANLSRLGSSSNALPGITTFGTVACGLLLFAMTLGWKADWISRWLAPDDPAPVTGPEMSAEALMPVGCMVAGLFAVSRALPTFFRLISMIALTPTTLRETWEDDEWKISLGADLLLAAWGFWLMFGNRGLIRIVRWARSSRDKSNVE